MSDHEFPPQRMDVNLRVDGFDRFIHLLERLLLQRHGQPTRLAFELPTRTVNGVIMSDFPLNNDAVYTATVKATNAGGAFEPIPAGDTFTAASSDPVSLGVAMGTDASGNVAVVLTPLVQAATGITVTVTDATGLTAATAIFDIVADATPVALTLDVVDATHVPQPVPAS